MNKKIISISALLLALCILAIILAQNLSMLSNIGQKDIVISAAKNYFIQYYETLKSGKNEDISYLFTGSNNSKIPQRILSNACLLNQEFNKKIIDYKLDIEIKRVVIRRNTATVNVVVDARYLYDNVPADLYSRTSNIQYQFKLMKMDNKWLIDSIDSPDDDAYVMIKENILKRTKTEPQKSQTEIYNEVFDEMDRNTKEIKKSFELKEDPALVNLH